MVFKENLAAKAFSYPFYKTNKQKPKQKGIKYISALNGNIWVTAQNLLYADKFLCCNICSMIQGMNPLTVLMQLKWRAKLPLTFRIT